MGRNPKMATEEQIEDIKEICNAFNLDHPYYEKLTYIEAKAFLEKWAMSYNYYMLNNGKQSMF